MKITQVAIAKNEELNLSSCFGKLSKICNYQILVDTGSEDNTIKIAKDMGIEVYEFEWINDFSAAKNFALSKIPEDTDWVIFLDLDESFDDEIIDSIVPLIDSLEKSDKKDKIDGLVTPIYNIDGEGNTISIIPNVSPRLFKWQKGLSFENAIHETLSLNGGIIRMTYTKPELKIIHTGYIASEFKNKNKSKRNCDILKSELEKDPNNIDLIVQYADSALAGGDLFNSKNMYCKASMLIDEKTSEFTRNALFRNLMNVIALEPNDNDKDKIDQFLWAYTYAKNLSPDNPDWDYLLGIFAHDMKMQNISVMALNTAMTLKSKFNGFVEICYNEDRIKEVLKEYNAWVE